MTKKDQLILSRPICPYTKITKSAATGLEALSSLHGMFVTDWASVSNIPSGWNTATIPTTNHSSPRASNITQRVLFVNLHFDPALSLSILSNVHLRFGNVCARATLILSYVSVSQSVSIVVVVFLFWCLFSCFS